MSKYDFIIDDMTWSFSRLSSYHTCPYSFKLSYIDCVKGENNFFGEYGSFCHGIIEKYCKGESEIYELSSLYEKEFNNNIIHKAPPNKFVNLNQSYYDSGLSYFKQFNGFDEFEIVATEKEIFFKIDNIKIKGYIDLLVKDKDGNFHIIDHKSSDPKSANSEKAKEYWKQMTLYSIGIYDEYDIYPVKLHINAFRKNQWFSKNFDIKAVDEVKQWVKDTVNKITIEEKFLPLSEGYFCNFLCNYRNKYCEYKERI